MRITICRSIALACAVLMMSHAATAQSLHPLSGYVMGGSAESDGGSYADRHAPVLSAGFGVAIRRIAGGELAVGGGYTGVVQTVDNLCPIGNTFCHPSFPPVNSLFADIAWSRQVPGFDVGASFQPTLSFIGMSPDVSVTAGPAAGVLVGRSLGGHFSLVAAARVGYLWFRGSTLSIHQITAGLRVR
jgi:hypothetical protein